MTRRLAGLMILVVLLAGCGPVRSIDALGSKHISPQTARNLAALTACSADYVQAANVLTLPEAQRRTLLNAAIDACPENFAETTKGYAADFLVFDQEAAVSVRKLAREQLIEHLKLNG